MNDVQKVTGAIYRSIQAVNELLPPGQALETENHVVLLGNNAQLDSMGFVNFIVALEQELERELGKGLNIADLLDVQTEDGSSVSTVADLIKVLSERLG
jgi:acyl carrier protein